MDVDAKEMWQGLGPTLDTLSIRGIGTEVYKKTMGDIQTFCRRLTSANIGFLHGTWEAHAELYMSYGVQLKHVNLFSWPTAATILVCPNVYCNRANGIREDVPSMKALAERVKRIDKGYFCHDKFEAMQTYRNGERYL